MGMMHVPTKKIDHKMLEDHLSAKIENFTLYYDYKKEEKRVLNVLYALYKMF